MCGVGPEPPDRDGPEDSGADRGEMAGEDDARARARREAGGGEGPEELEPVGVEGVGEQRDVEQGRAECDEPGPRKQRAGPDSGEEPGPTGETHRADGHRERGGDGDERRGAEGGADGPGVGADRRQERRDRHGDGAEHGQDERGDEDGRAARHAPTLRRRSDSSRRDTP